MASITTSLKPGHDLHDRIESAVNGICGVLLGKERQVRLALCCLFSGGHLLIEDLPGMGKTSLAQALARVLGLSYNRVQFTSDLLPADILGATIFEREAQRFQFIPGPVFTQLLLADEINRATPKTQSALLEAMAEHQVSVEGQSHPLPQPFFVIATQNPLSQAGTYPLPESQLDRFLMCIGLGYPDPAAERRLLLGEDSAHTLPRLQPLLQAADLKAIAAAVDAVHLSEPVLDYVQRLIRHSRQQSGVQSGLSPRGALALVRSARTWALMAGRQHVVPEDVQQVLPAVVGHRLQAAVDYSGDSVALTEALLRDVPVL